MEGYTNVSGNHEDFDDLNIESRDTLDGDDTKEKNELEVQRLRNIKVKLDDGGFGYVFSIKTTDHSERWRCHLCDVVVISQKHVETHIQTKKHQLKLTLPSHPPELFARVENKKSAVEIPQLAPGEPVPPGFEDVVKRVTQIQATLDSHISSPLIGLEYLVELAPDERGKEPMYICMLCDKKGDPRVVMAHLTSYNHRAKYIGIYYPTANKALFNEFPRTKEGKKGMLEIVTRICTKIEDKYGRLQPLVVEKEIFDTRKDQIIKQITEEQHFRETPDETFVELVDLKVLEELAAQEEEPEVEIIPTAENRSTFNKGKISCDRSRLRARDEDDNIEEESKLKHSTKGSREPSSKKFKLHSANFSRKSLSSISSLSSSSCSRSRSRSRSKSRSRSGSYARSRYGYHGWKEGKYNKSSWSRSRRSRSGSRGRRHFRSDSRSRSRRSRSYSPGSRYGRRVSPDSPSRSRYRYGRSGSPKYNRYHDNYNEKYNKYREKSDRKDPYTEEKSKWEKFRQEVGKLEHELTKNLKFHEKNPEKHPMYPEEWKKFWNRRYKELQAEGEDPSKHDFKPEWVEFWNKRLKEMHEEELKNKKEELKLKIGLPKEKELQHPRAANKKKLVQDPDIIEISSGKEDETSKKDVTVTDIKNTWKAFTGSDIKGTTKRSPSPWEEEKPQRGSPSRRPQRGGAFSRGRGRGGRIYGFHHEESGSCGVVSVLRLLTAMENQLGSLGPRVNTLLATALSMDKARPNSSEALLSNSEHIVLLETVKEKLRGQLFAGIVERNMVIASRSCVQKLENLLAKADELNKSVTPSLSDPSKIVEPLPPTSLSVAVEPVTVPGVGTVDKVAIAQQIASALVAQGKTDVTQEELEQLINAVVGMAQASVDSEHPVSTAAFVSQLQQQQSSDKKSAIKSSNAFEEKSPLQKLLSVVTSGKNNPSDVKSNQSRISALQLLQSAYEEPKRLGLKDLFPSFKNQFSLNKSGMASGQFMSTSDCMEDLSEDDLKTLLQNFKDLSSEEQQGLISYLKKLETKEPDRVEKLRQFVNLEGGISHHTFHNIKDTLNPSGTSNSKSDHLGRLSPFSLRHGGINPSQESGKEFGNVFSNKDMENQRKPLKLDDSDDDYSFEDIYAAASKKVKEREKAIQEEEAKMKQLTESNKIKEERDMSVNKRSDDPTLILKETKEMIANIMGQLPSKFMQKQGGSPRTGSPAMQGHHTRIGSEMKPLTSGPEIGGQKIQALGSETVPPSRPAQSVPTLEDSRCLNQIYPNAVADPSYASQFGKQQPFPVGTQNYSENRQSFPTQQPVYSGHYEQNRQFDDRYLGNSHQQYPQQAVGTYTAPFTNQPSNTGGWTQYTDQYGQQQNTRNPLPGGPFTRYPYQPTYY